MIAEMSFPRFDTMWPSLAFISQRFIGLADDEEPHDSRLLGCQRRQMGGTVLIIELSRNGPWCFASNGALFFPSLSLRTVIISGCDSFCGERARMKVTRCFYRLSNDAFIKSVVRSSRHSLPSRIVRDSLAESGALIRKWQGRSKEDWIFWKLCWLELRFNRKIYSELG